MICAQAIVQFRPHESYEKYLKLLVSVMVLVQLFLPMGRLFTDSGRMELEALLKSFRESLEQGMEEARRQAEETDALLQQMTLEEVRRRMEEQGAGSDEDESVKETVKEEDVKETAKKDEDEEDSEDAASGVGDRAKEGRVTVEVEPIEPILGE